LDSGRGNPVGPAIIPDIHETIVALQYSSGANFVGSRTSSIARFAPSTISRSSDSKPSASSEIASSFTAMLSDAPFTSECAIACSRSTERPQAAPYLRRPGRRTLFRPTDWHVAVAETDTVRPGTTRAAEGWRGAASAGRS
jgi:hypothetical protein